VRPPVVAIGLDAFAPELLERWTRESRLPTLARMMGKGTYARQANTSLYRVENSWLTFLQGCSPERSNEWGHHNYHGSTGMTERASYRFERHPPFYALGDARRVAVFDIPLTGQVEGVDGIQLLGWGTEVNQVLRQSSPPGLMAQLIARHGRHPLYATIRNADDGTETLSYRIPCLYDRQALRSARDALVSAARQRGQIIVELLERERWDLLMAVFAECHTAGHLFWHLSQEHALAPLLRQSGDGDFMFEVARAIDEGLAAIEQALPPGAVFMVFSPHGMQGNTLDTYSMLLLPELIYRWSTGRAALALGDASAPVPPPAVSYSRHWRDEVWDLRTAHGAEVLESPAEQELREDPLDWDPGNWYRKAWPAMKAYVLPGYSEGLVRVNVQGRDGTTGVPSAQFAAVSEELISVIHALRDARTGESIVQEVVRVRSEPGASPGSPADLMVVWRDDCITDVVDHPVHGRIGPVPYFRSGGHSTEGFFLAQGPQFPPGLRLPSITTPDVTATVLEALGVPRPAHLEGKPVRPNLPQPPAA